jgi:hypothetical protein
MAKQQGEQAGPEQAMASPGSSDKVKNTRKGTRPEDYKVFTNLEEARGGRPDGKQAWQLWQITSPDGVHRWIWCGWGSEGLWELCVQDGWSMISMEDVPSKVEVSAMLTALSSADREELLKQFAESASHGKGNGGKGKGK